MVNKKSRKIALELADKIEGLTKKHGVKIVGIWSVFSEHLTVSVWDAPSLEALQKLSSEPEFAAWYSIHTGEVKVAVGMADTAKMMRQLK